MSKKNPLNDLLSNAQTAEDLLPEKGAVPPTKIVEHATKKNENIYSEKKDLNVYFNRREDKSTEPTRLPEHIHKKLKLLSLASGTSIEALTANIIEKILQDNKKEINSYLKKNLNIL